MKQDKAIAKVIDYLWKDEMVKFQNEYEVVIQSQHTLEDWIETCEKQGWTDHVFYHLMVLKQQQQ